MKEDAPRVIKIPAKPEATRQADARRQLRVAAYCRVSTKEEDQANSYEVQKEYYTDNADNLTMREVQNVFQLDPEPPQMELNDYIREAVRKRDLSYFSFFLHHFEKRLNGVIYRFLTRSGYDRYDPARFLDYKLEVLQMLLFLPAEVRPGAGNRIPEIREAL